MPRSAASAKSVTTRSGGYRLLRQGTAESTPQLSERRRRPDRALVEALEEVRGNVRSPPQKIAQLGHAAMLAGPDGSVHWRA